VREWLEAGACVLALDYRGVGETKSSEEVAVKNSLVLGRHILGMQVYDVIRAVDYLTLKAGFNRVYVYGEREAGVVALLAGALDERISAVHTLEMPSTLVSSKGFRYPPTLFPPNILKYADIPEIAAMIAPRPLVIDYPVGPDLRKLSVSEAEENFRLAREVYEYLGALWNLTIRALG